MASFHINPKTGDIGECNADPSKPGAKGCPFGGAEEHYSTPGEAREHFERSMVSVPTPSVSKTTDRKTARLELQASVPEEQQFHTMETFNASDAIAAKAQLVKQLSAEEQIEQGWKLPDGLSGPTWREYTREVSGASGLLKNLNAQRYAIALNGERARDPRSIQELITTGEIQEDTPARRLTDGELSAAEALAELSKPTQDAIQKLPAGFLKVMTDTPIGESNTKALVKLTEEIRAVEPTYVPREGITPPQRITGRRSSEGVPQMQHMGAHGYGLLQKYAEVKFGSQAKEFWHTVESNTGNYPKISDFVRAVKNFA